MSRGIIIGLGSLLGVGVISSIAALKGGDETPEGRERLLGSPPPVNRATKPPGYVPSSGGFTGYYGGKKHVKKGKKKHVKKGKKKNVKKAHKKH